MRKQYVRTIIITESDPAVFHRKLTEIINDAQNQGLEVDIQYSIAGIPPAQVSGKVINSIGSNFIQLDNYRSFTEVIAHSALVLFYKII